MTSPWTGSGRWPIAAYDRLYRWLHRLDRPGARVGPVVRLRVRASRRTLVLRDGTVIRPTDSIGVIHLDNERVAAALHGDGRGSQAIGLDFRRQFVASLRELAVLSDPDRSLAHVRV